MNVSIKNKKLAFLMTILTILNVNNVSAAPKTWSKDANGRVLIYRVEPSIVAAILPALMTAVGLGVSSIGFLMDIESSERRSIVGLFGLMGSMISVPGALIFKYCYYDPSNLLYKPLVVMDKHGITYEGKDKILWKNVCAYQVVQHIIYDAYGRMIGSYYCIQISTDVDRLEISENSIAITYQKLYQLIDEAYKSYKELEKQRGQVIQEPEA